MKAFSIALILAFLTAAPARADEILISNMDHFSFLTIQRFTATQWLTASFTTDGNSYELTRIEPAARATTLSASLVAELRSGAVPGPFIASFTRDPGVPVIFRPDSPVTLQPNTTYHFSLGYPDGNATISEWYSTENFDTVGPATLDQGFVSSDQGATWATGGFLEDERFFFEVVVAPPACANSTDVSLGPGLALEVGTCTNGGAGYYWVVRFYLSGGGSLDLVQTPLPEGFSDSYPTAYVPSDPPVAAICSFLIDLEVTQPPPAPIGSCVVP